MSGRGLAPPPPRPPPPRQPPPLPGTVGGGSAPRAVGPPTTGPRCCRGREQGVNSNKLKLNNDKTELIVFKNKHQIKDHIDETICINDIEIQSSCVIKNLGVIFDEDLSMTSHVKNVCKSITFQLGKISSIRKFITTDVTKTLVTSLILSRFDYCNSLFCSMTSENIDKLQLLQNHAARLIFGKKKRDHITPILIKLHWLPIHQRIEYKVALFCFICIHNLALIYLPNLLET